MQTDINQTHLHNAELEHQLTMLKEEIKCDRAEWKRDVAALKEEVRGLNASVKRLKEAASGSPRM